MSSHDFLRLSSYDERHGERHGEESPASADRRSENAWNLDGFHSLIIAAALLGGLFDSGPVNMS